MLDCLVRLKDTAALTAFFDPPESSAEAIHLMEALWIEGKRDRLLEVLKIALIAASSDPSVDEMRVKSKSRLNR